jgi:arsenate reductase-like glutaredoxin family protein
MDGRPITIRETVNAAKDKIGAKDLKGVLKDATKLVVAKGKKVVTIDLPKDKPTAAEIAKAMLGPTGNLRAPTVRLGKKVLGGFSAEIYEEFLG